MALPIKLPLDRMQTIWKSQIDPILKIPMLNGLQLTNISLISGDNVINHLLQRNQQGWIVTDQSAASSLCRSQPLNNLTLTLNSSNPCVISLWVY